MLRTSTVGTWLTVAALIAAPAAHAKMTTSKARTLAIGVICKVYGYTDAYHAWDASGLYPKVLSSTSANVRFYGKDHGGRIRLRSYRKSRASYRVNSHRGTITMAQAQNMLSPSGEPTC